MSLLAAYKYADVSSNAAPGSVMVNIGGGQISGQSYNAGLMCCLYVWNETNTQWEPMLQPATT